MRASSLGLPLLIITQAWAWCGLACAQAPDAPTRADRAGENAADSPQAVKRVEPSILYVKDAEGEMVPLLDLTLDQIEELRELQGGMGAAPRPGGFRIERMEARGEARPQFASLTVQFTIHASDKNWVRVPLKLGGLALTEPAVHQGEGEQFLEYDTSGREYVSWFRGETQKPHMLTLKGLVPLERVGAQTRLKLGSPRAVHSELTLKVPLPHPVGEASLGAVLATTRQEGAVTEFKTIGLTSDFVLSWREKAEPTLDAPAALDASARLVVQVNQQSVQTRATLTVKAFGREFDAFRVRLPPGATLIAEERKDYAVKPLDNAAGPNPAANEPQWVEVSREKRSAEPFEVQLTTRRAHDEAATGKPVELSGFEVQGAARQSGAIAIAADHNWQVSFGKRTGVRQVEDLPENARLDDARAGDWVASFEYYRQPFSLPLYVSPRETVISVDPTYTVHVGAHRLELHAQLAYRVGGAKAFSLEIDAPGWDVDVTKIGPPEFVDASRIVAKPGMPLVIPLKRALFGDLKLTFLAQRDLAPDAKTVEFQLPRPAANTLGVANLTVIPAQNVELVPREAALEGLSRQAASADLEPPAEDQDALYYRGDSADARFSADFRVHPRQISVEAFNRVELGETGAQVAQTFSYRIAYEPAATLAFDLPSELFEQARFEIRHDDKVLPWESVDDRDAEPAAGEDSARLVRIRINLPEPRIGACDLKFVYPWTGKPLIRQASVALNLPLAMPADAECTENLADVIVEPGVKAELLGEDWNPLPQDDEHLADDAAQHFSSAQPRPEITFSATLADRPLDGTLTVERAWIRTELTKHRRIDRAVYRFESRDPRFSLILPPGSRLDDFALFSQEGQIDASQTQGQLPDEYVVTWRDGGRDARPHALEVHYSLPDRGAERRRLPLELPKLTSGINARRTYWQLILPRDEYLIGSPSEMTPEMFWDWRNFHWERRPLLDQRFLESWVFDPSHLAGRGEAPLQAGNEYLFSGVEVSGPAEVRIAPRSTLVLIGSGAVLFAGLMLIYVPLLRRPALLFLGAVAAVAAALLYPEMTLLWMQAALVGAALTAVAALLERNVSRRRRRETLMRGGASSIVSRNPARPSQRGGPAAPVSTETAVPVEFSSSEVRP